MVKKRLPKGTDTVAINARLPRQLWAKCRKEADKLGITITAYLIEKLG